MTRKEARESGFKFLFEYEVQKGKMPDELEQFYGLNPEAETQKEYIDSIIAMTIENLDQIDMLIAENSKNRVHGRISKVSLAALRIGIAEMLYSDLDDNIAISEAVRIAKKYEGEKSSSFVNGILSTIYKAGNKKIEVDEE